MTSTYQTTANGNVYYDISIPNKNLFSDIIPAEPATFFEVRTSSILTGKPREYTMAVVRASIPTSTIPLKLIEIEPSPPLPAPVSSNINDTAYTVTLSWNGLNSVQRIIWITQSPNARVPTTVPRGVVVNSQFWDYYSLLDVQHFINLINTALAAALAALLGAPTANPPFLYLNPSTKLISLYADQFYTPDTVNVNGPIEIYFNNFLGNNFASSFDIRYFRATAPFGKQQQYLVYDIESKNRETIGAITYYVMTQEYNTRSAMSSFQSLLFISDSIPVRNEQISSQVPGADPSTSRFFRIIQDLEIDQIPFEVPFNRITYNPSAEFRRMTLTSDNNDDMRTFDIQIFWRDVYDNIYILYILPGQVATIKFLFEKIPTVMK